MFKVIRDLKLNNKINIVIIVMVIMSTLVTALYSFKNSSSIMITESLKNLDSIVRQCKDYNDQKIPDIIRRTYYLLLSKDFQTVLDDILYGEGNYELHFTRFSSIFSEFKMGDLFISSIILYTPKGVFYEASRVSVLHSDMEKLSLLEGFKGNMEDGIMWKNARPDDVLGTSDRIISFAMKLPAFEDERKLVLVVNLKEQEILDYFEAIKTNPTDQIVILDDTGEIVLGDAEDEYKSIISDSKFKELVYDNKSGHFRYYGYQEGSNYLVSFNTQSVADWKVVYLKSENELKQELNNAGKTIFMSVIICILVAIPLSFLLSKSITNPLYRLQLVVRKIADKDFSARVSNDSQDEVGELGRNINFMINEIKELIENQGHLIEVLYTEKENVKKEQIAKRKAEIKALQAQINPHFLYNTLDSIYWNINIREKEEASRMILSLSDMLRLSLSKGNEFITINDEITHVKSYLELQKANYEDRFNFDVYAQKEVLSYLVPKVILQPLVENSLLHGFEGVEHKGYIKIVIEEASNQVKINISDNGNGFGRIIENEDIHAIPEVKSGFGMNNVYNRLLLEYGDTLQFRISSTPGEGTMLVIIIPARS